MAAQHDTYTLHRFEDVFSMQVARLVPPPNVQVPIGSHLPEEKLVKSAEMGSVFVGELLQFCISLKNTLNAVVTKFEVRFELQFGGKRIKLLNTRLKDSKFPANETRDYKISQIISSVGAHTLYCYVAFNYRADRKHFQSSYKFSAVKCVETVFKARDCGEDLSFVEFRITNVTERPLRLESVDFKPTQFYVTENIDPSVRSSEAEHNLPLVQNPNEVRSMVFRVVPRDPTAPTTVESNILGVVDVRWRSDHGNFGQTMTDNIVRRREHPATHFEIIVTQYPLSVYVEKPFECTFEVRNNTKQRQTLNILLAREKMGALLPFGTHQKSLGMFQPLERKSVTLQFIALACGNQRMSGIFLNNGAKQLVFNHLCDVTVIQE